MFKFRSILILLREISGRALAEATRFGRTDCFWLLEPPSDWSSFLRCRICPQSTSSERRCFFKGCLWDDRFWTLRAGQRWPDVFSFLASLRCSNYLRPAYLINCYWLSHQLSHCDISFQNHPITESVNGDYADFWCSSIFCFFKIYPFNAKPSTKSQSPGGWCGASLTEITMATSPPRPKACLPPSDTRKPWVITKKTPTDQRFLGNLVFFNTLVLCVLRFPFSTQRPKNFRTKQTANGNKLRIYTSQDPT